MLPAPTRLSIDPGRAFRRSVWITWAIIMIVAAVLYAGKAADDRSAFVRWRHQVLELFEGVNIYDRMLFPNPPIMPITLYPLMVLPSVVGAVGWFALKVGMTVVSTLLCFRMVKVDEKPIPPWVQGTILLLSLRPILSDLHHGNNNLFILFLVVTTLYSWRSGYDVLAGLILGFAISYKVTPALFVPYFVYKRSWRTVGATFLGLGLFLVIVPSLVLGPQFNIVCLTSWWNRIIGPYVQDNDAGVSDINQSMVGVITRLLTDAPRADGRYAPTPGLNLVSWDPDFVVTLLKGVSLGLVGMIGLLCRTKADQRKDPRLIGEFALVVLTMLFVSERSWKHHYVTLLLPFTYITYRLALPRLLPRDRGIVAGSLVLAMLFMATTSSELGGWFVGGQGHKIAQAYGMFFWAGVVLYLATAWRLLAERTQPPWDQAVGSGETPPNPLSSGPHISRSSQRTALGQVRPG